MIDTANPHGRPGEWVEFRDDYGADVECAGYGGAAGVCRWRVRA